MRIAYIINSLEGGGAALPVPALCDVLRAEGAQVVILALARRDGRALPAMHAAGLEVRVFAGDERIHTAPLRWLDEQVRGWGATHLWTSLSRATLLGQVVGQRRRLPVVSWQHAAWLKPANLRLMRWRRGASAIWVADSEAVWRFARDRIGVDEARLMLWPIFRADPDAPQARAWRPGEPVRIGSLGRLHPVKGYDVLADALAEGIDARVTIGGDGPIRDMIAERSGGRLDLAGFVGAPRDFLAGLHLYAQPSRSEGFCLAVHEAMQAGLPVIASAVGEIAGSVLPGKTGWLVPPGNAPALADALRQALADPARLAAMGAAGRARLLDHYGPDRFAAAGAAIIARLRRMGGGRSG